MEENTNTQQAKSLFAQDNGPILVEQTPTVATHAPIQHAKDRAWEPTGGSTRSDGAIGSRPPITGEASGRRTLIRAAFTAAFGGAIIGLTSAAFGPRFLVADVRVLGIFVGLAIIGLAAVSPIDADAKKHSAGVFIIVLAILGFPIAAGGYFVGSIVAVIGGALLLAYEPPGDNIEIVYFRAGRIRRATGLIVDFLVAFVLQRILYTLVPAFFNSTINVLIAWAFCWLVMAVLPALIFRRTAGRILVILRLADTDNGDRAPFMSTLVREVLRGVIAIGSFFIIAWAALGDSLSPGRAGLALIALAVVGFIAERFQFMDRVTNTVSVYDSIVRVEPADEVSTDRIEHISR